MPEMIFDRRRTPAADVVRQPVGRLPIGQAANLSLALIVFSSPISRIVVSRIAAQACMKVACEPPERATEALFSQRPGLVILDCGPNHEELYPIATAIVDQRRACVSRLPLLIVLATKSVPADSPFATIADAIIAKPITPDALQPKIEQLVRDARG